MSNSKISALTAATTPLAGTETLPVVQSGVTKQVSVANLTAGRNVSMADLTTTGNNILGDASTDTLNVGNGGIIKDAAGNVGINATPSAWASARAIDLGNYSAFATGLNYQANIANNAYYDGAWKYKTAGYEAALYTQDAGRHFLYTKGTGSANAAIGFTSILSTDLTGNITVVAGNLVIGTSGKGIDFSATPSTGTSEILKDYEEGVFDVTFAPATSGTITLYSIYNQMAYTRVGRLVTVTGLVIISAVSVPVGAFVTMSSLPFQVANLTEGSGYSVGVMSWYDSSTATHSTTAYPVRIGNNATTVQIAINAALLAADDQLTFSFSYLTTA